MILKKVFPALMFLSLFTLLSCGKDNETPATGGYPKTVKVTYKVTGTIKTTKVIFANETLGNTSLDNQTIPFTKELNITVKTAPTAIAFGLSSVEAGNAKLEILVDGKVVETQDFSSNTFVSGTIAYVFK